MAALRALRAARTLLKKAGAPQATKKVRVALKSAEGAFRHICRRRHATRDAMKAEWEKRDGY